MNTVKSLLSRPFSEMSIEEKLEVKRLGPDKPDISSSQESSSRRFTPYWYGKYQWMTGCPETKRVYCFPCILFGQPLKEKAWSRTGIVDWKHLSERVQKHIKSRSHIDNSLKLAFLGKTDIRLQMSEAYRATISKHNAEVDANRHVLSKIVDCIRFCGSFELALRGHNEKEDSNNPGIFLGLVDFTAQLDSVLKHHLESATVFKGTSKTIQNELLDIMLDITQDFIRKEIEEAMFVAVIADDTTDVSNELQNVVVLRYVVDSKVVERFWTFCRLSQGNATSISDNILSCLENVMPRAEDKEKLIAQCYDGASVMRGGRRGVKTVVQEVYPNAHYVHCYAHQLNLIMQQAVSQLPEIRLFFANLSGFSTFFSRSPARTAYLDNYVARRIPRSSQTRWNFKSRVVFTVSSYRSELIECLEELIGTWKGDPITVREASGLLHWLRDRNFCIYLNFFKNVMPHLDILYAHMQKREIDPLFIQNSIDNFILAVNGVRDKIQHILSDAPREENYYKRPRLESADQEKSRILNEVCDIIISHSCSRFQFSGHLLSAVLLHSEKFASYADRFPLDIFNEACKSYPMLNRNKLESELSVIYSREELRSCSGIVALFDLLVSSNLSEAFSEVVKLLHILMTIPMTSCEAERSFSTLKRVKTFLRNSMSEERLNALAMLSLEKKLIRDNVNFNKLVIERFSNQKERRAKFLYK